MDTQIKDKARALLERYEEFHKEMSKEISEMTKSMSQKEIMQYLHIGKTNLEYLNSGDSGQCLENQMEFLKKILE